jgi:hypothetical protein
LRAFLNKLAAQSGKKIDPATVHTLQAEVEDIIHALSSNRAIHFPHRR